MPISALSPIAGEGRINQTAKWNPASRSKMRQILICAHSDRKTGACFCELPAATRFTLTITGSGIAPSSNKLAL
jgi:hypothetical protein